MANHISPYNRDVKINQKGEKMKKFKTVIDNTDHLQQVEKDMDSLAEQGYELDSVSLAGTSILIVMSKEEEK